MKKSKTYILILLFIIIINSCKEATDFYLGIPLQPRFEDNNFQEGLNIFGIIRVDSTGRYNNSFVEVQKIIPAIGTEDSILVDTSKVYLEHIVNQEIYEFSLTDFDSTFSQTYYRPKHGFNPHAGDVFKIECIYAELPILTAYTIVPEVPKWDINSILIEDNIVRFDLKPDSTIFMYDLYVFSNGFISGYSRLAAENDSSDTRVFLEYSGEKADSILAFGYDYNLATYYLTTNISLNFNKYRESFSIVENGFGVFGSINSNVLILSE